MMHLTQAQRLECQDPHHYKCFQPETKEKKTLRSIKKKKKKKKLTTYFGYMADEKLVFRKLSKFSCNLSSHSNGSQN